MIKITNNSLNNLFKNKTIKIKTIEKGVYNFKIPNWINETYIQNYLLLTLKERE